MAVWVDKITGDTVAADDPNTLADGFGATYNFGVDTTVKQLTTYHAAGGAHTARIDTGDLIDLAVSAAKIGALAVTEGKIGALAVTEGKIAALAVAEGKLAANAVTNAKLAGMVRGTIKVGSAAGAASDLALGTAAKLLQSDGTDAGWVAMSGDATIAAGGALAIANNAVTEAKINALAVTTAKIAADAVDNTKLANITRGSVKVGGASDAPTDLNAKTSGYILVGDGTDVKSVAVSGDVTLAANGAVAIGASKITKAMMAADVLSGTGNTAARPASAKAGYLYWNTQTAVIERDTGEGAFAEVTGTISAAHVNELTTYGLTDLHYHSGEDTPTLVYGDHAVTATASGAAPALMEYEYADPGSNSSVTKIRFTIFQKWTSPQCHLHVRGQAQVTADPDPATADVQAYVTDGGVDTAGAIAHITSYGTWANFDVNVDLSTLAENVPHYVEVRLVWTSDSASGQTAKMRFVSAHTAVA